MKNTIQHRQEWNKMIKHIGHFNSFIEIGTHKGGTFEELSKRCNGLKISIDLCSGSFGGIGSESAKERNEIISRIYDNTHFIEGDSKHFDTVLKLNAILNGKKVDFLFIDGDHTFYGAQSDYIIYKQFVKQGGFIAFHDIVSSDFHAARNCHVAKLWAKLNGVSFISPDNSDCSEDAKGFDNEFWGGIGVIKNESQPINIFQIFYDNESLQKCLKSVNNYLPELILNTEKIYFENAVIRRIYETYKFKPTDFIGITSPLITQKTKLTIDNIVEYCNEPAGNLVNYWNESNCNKDVWKVNKEKGDPIYHCAKELNESGVLKFDIFEKDWEKIYCNYWLVTYDIFEVYCKEVLIPAMNYFNTSKWIKWDDSINGLKHRGRYYPMAVFVLESLFGSFYAKYKKI